MCIILHASTPSAVRAVTDDHVTRAWDGNPHGAGIAYRLTPTSPVRIVKGLMTLAALRAALASLQPRACELAVHFRLATHGARTPALTHPFHVRHGALIHNGIFSVRGIPDVDSDTSYVARTLAGLPPARIVDAIDACGIRNGSRVLILAHDPAQTIKSGDWIASTIDGLSLSQGYTLPGLVPRRVELFSDWKLGDCEADDPAGIAAARKRRAARRPSPVFPLS